MRKYLLFAAAVVALSAFQACEKDKETTDAAYRTVGLTREILISNIAGNHPEISDVALVARFHIPPGVHSSSATAFQDKDTRILLHVPFDRRQTRLVLPENPPEALLSNITNDIPEGFSISDTDANTLSFVEIACNMGDTGTVTETLYLGSTVGEAVHRVTYIYCDRSATVTGTGKDWWDHPLTYDLKLEKGWNVVVEKTVYDKDALCRSETISNRMPKDVEWLYGMWLGGR